MYVQWWNRPIYLWQYQFHLLQLPYMLQNFAILRNWESHVLLCEVTNVCPVRLYVYVKYTHCSYDALGNNEICMHTITEPLVQVASMQLRRASIPNVTVGLWAAGVPGKFESVDLTSRKVRGTSFVRSSCLEFLTEGWDMLLYKYQFILLVLGSSA